MIPGFANIALPVKELLRLNPSTKQLSWTDDGITSFNNLKQALCLLHVQFYLKRLSNALNIILSLAVLIILSVLPSIK